MIEVLVVSSDDQVKLNAQPTAELHISKCLNNRKNLTVVYNEFLAACRIMPELPEFVILMHGDVDVDMTQLIVDLRRCNDKYDVFGLCGTEALNVSQSPLNWYTGSQHTPDKRWGCVTHGELGNQKSFFSQNKPERDHEVACIDGLCIIFGPIAIQSNLKFDEQLRYNGYDTQISLSCVLEYHMRLGVVIEETLIHQSVGKSILSKEFLIDEQILRNRFKI